MGNNPLSPGCAFTRTTQESVGLPCCRGTMLAPIWHHKESRKSFSSTKSTANIAQAALPQAQDSQACPLTLCSSCAGGGFEDIHGLFQQPCWSNVCCHAPRTSQHSVCDGCPCNMCWPTLQSCSVAGKRQVWCSQCTAEVHHKHIRRTIHGQSFCAATRSIFICLLKNSRGNAATVGTSKMIYVEGVRADLFVIDLMCSKYCGIHSYLLSNLLSSAVGRFLCLTSLSSILAQSLRNHAQC